MFNDISFARDINAYIIHFCEKPRIVSVFLKNDKLNDKRIHFS